MKTVRIFGHTTKSLDETLNIFALFSSKNAIQSASIEIADQKINSTLTSFAIILSIAELRVMLNNNDYHNSVNTKLTKYFTDLFPVHPEFPLYINFPVDSNMFNNELANM